MVASNTDGNPAATASPPAPEEHVRLAEWFRALEQQADTWALLLVEEFDVASSLKVIQVQREILAYGKRLLALRHPVRGFSCSPVDAIGRRPSLDVLSGAPESELRAHATPPGADANPSQVSEAGVGIVQGASGPRVTPAAFNRFCRWTGMDPGCLCGPPEHVAALVFYVVVFSLLTDEGASPNLGAQRLLQKLRFCREQLTRHVDAWFSDRSSREDVPPQGADREVLLGNVGTTSSRRSAGSTADPTTP